MNPKDRPTPSSASDKEVEMAQLTSDSGETFGQNGVVAPGVDHVQQVLAPPHGPGELGWLAHFRVLKLLGQGGMGMVFHAEDSKLKRAVALKVIRPDRSNDTHRKRLLREARACARVEVTDHIVTIYDVGEEKGIPFIAMQYLKGMPLSQWLIKQGRRLALRDVLRIGREVASGLAVAHSHGLIHRDIKPANLWLEAPSGRVKILDFGLARPVEEDDSDEITQVGHVVGTPGYLAPEQVDGGDITAQTDLFSLGCVLYELATGETPFPGKGALARLKALVTRKPRPAIQANPDLPEALSDLLEKLMDLNPANRPESASAVVAILQKIEAGLRLSTQVNGDEMETVDDKALFGAMTEDLPVSKNVAPARSVAKRTPPWLYPSIGALTLVAAGLVYLITRKEDKPPTTGNEIVNNQPESQGPISTPRKALLDRPMDEREKDSMAKLSIEEQSATLRKDLARWNQTGFFPQRPNALSVDTLGGKTIRSVDIDAESLADLTPLRSLPELSQVSIAAANKPVNLKGLAGLKLSYLNIRKAHIDIADLGEMRSLTHLDVEGCTIANGEKIAVMYLRNLNLSQTGMKHLDWLASQPTIEKLEMRNLPLTSLKPLTNVKKLAYLDFTDCLAVEQADGLAGLPLKEIKCTYRPAYGVVFKQIPSLTTINGKTRDEFFKE